LNINNFFSAKRKKLQQFLSKIIQEPTERYKTYTLLSAKEIFSKTA